MPGATACDVAVIGGGPAGSRAAALLARAGARVALFDAGHPREKSCGGGITGRALALVADTPGLAELPAVTIRSARFAADGSDGVAVPLADDANGTPALVVASRSDFDACLFDGARAAGATIVPARVRDVSLSPAGVAIQTSRGSWRAAFVVGADGVNSLVRRRVAAPFGREQLSIATGFFAHGASGDEVVVDLLREPPGYIWSFPRPHHLAIGICGQADSGATTTALRARVGAWIERTAIAPGARLQPYSWPIPSLGAVAVRGLHLWGDRWCLAGDAAGLVDPITREGIYFALLSGQWAADALAAAGGGPAAYAARVCDEIVPELAHAARLKAGFFQPAFTSLMVRALAQSAGVRAVMADLVAGRQPYATLKRRLVGTFEWKLLWRLLRIERR